MNALFSLCIHTVMIFITVSFAAEKSDKKEHTETTQSPAFHGFSNKDTASEKDPRNPVPGLVSGRVYRNTVVKNASETNNDDVKGGSWTVYPEDDSPYVSYNSSTKELGNYQPLWLQPDHVHHGVSDTPAKSKKGRPVKVLYIGGFFELSGDPRMAAMGLSEKVAALMAIDHINEQDILPGYELRMFYGDTKCDPGTGADAFYDMVYTEQLMMLFGSSCSDVTSMIGQIVEYWNLLFVSHASSAPALSDRETFPTFYRLAAADVSHNAAQKKFIQHFNWNTVAIIHEDHEQYNLAVNNLRRYLERKSSQAVHTLQSTIEAANIKVALTTSFRIQDSNLPDKMRQIKDNDIRIIIGSFSEDIAYHVFCEAYRQQIYGLKYVWLLVGDFTSQWWEKSHNFSDCTVQELTEAVNGYFAVNSLNFIVGNSKSTSGLTNEKFEAQYDQKANEMNVRVTRSAHAPQMYDTVWTIALTLQAAANASGGLENFRYENGTVWKSLFFDIMGKLTFQGVSGPVSFTDTGDRRGISAFTRCQNGVMTSVALYYPNNDTLSLNCKECKPLLWTDGRPPADKYSVVIQRSLIDPVAFYTISALCGAGIFLALVFLFFNLLNLRRRYIKLSSPKLNNVAVIGCILVYSAVLLLGFDDGTLSSKLYPTVCTVRAFLFAAGFSLAFGAMFTKTYRVHQICIGAGTGLVKNKLLKDKHLFFIIGALLVFDSAIVSLWALADPMVRNEKNITTEPAPEDPHRILYVRQHLHCHSQQQNIWLGVFYTYKGLLMIFGTFLAWSTRKVKIEALNDSRYIGLSVYNVVVMSILVVALTAVIPDQPTLAYCIASSIIIVSTTVTLCLLFVPKIHALVKSSGNPVITTSGLTVEAETRRLTCDDSKEKLFRAEVQNRTFKSELAELEREISRLQILLDLPSDRLAALTGTIINTSNNACLRRRRQSSTILDLIGNADLASRQQLANVTHSFSIPHSRTFDECHRSSNCRASGYRHFKQKNRRYSTAVGNADDFNLLRHTSAGFISRLPMQDTLNNRYILRRPSWLTDADCISLSDLPVKNLNRISCSFRHRTKPKKVTKECGTQVSNYQLEVFNPVDIKYIDESTDDITINKDAVNWKNRNSPSGKRAKRKMELQQKLQRIRKELEELETTDI